MQQVFITFGLLIFFMSTAAQADSFKKQQDNLLKIINLQLFESRFSTGFSKMSTDVEKSMGQTPRHEFVPKEYRTLSYNNRPLSIGYGQTISQPLIVAMMTEIITPSKDHVVLEVGTGSGYQAAVLSSLVKEVHTIEIISQLATRAKKDFKRLGYKNIFSYTGDGYFGLAKHRLKNKALPEKFDSIIVTAAASHIPPSLIEQLKVGGKMIIPVGGVFQVQFLILVEKTSSGVKSKNILPVKFVPFTRN